ncbi:MAG: HAD-IC family P-type ATPase, partial [Oscillospiraceae bacterium]|nr:HAD-IC family P-type ATPase [Oscillospiraceae bacterium]
GVHVKVISGDNPMTVSEVAMEAGIVGAEKFIDASALEEKDMRSAVENYTVFGRVTPHQKRQLVAALKQNGHTVAMTGDGVNDVLALKDADCSIAMASGSDAAAQAAQMVLLESDFSKMPAVVNEGRRVVNNIERTASLFLVKNIFSLLLSVFSIIFMLNYPLEPSQISLIGMFTIGIPAFVMSLENNTGRIRGHFLSNVFFRALPAGLTDFAVISALVIFCREFRVSETDMSTSCTILLAIVGIMILYRIASPMTTLHWVLWIGMIFGLLFCMTFMNQVFAISMLSRKSAMLLVIFAIITEPALRYLSLLTKKIWQLAAWIRKKIRIKKEERDNMFKNLIG